MQNKLALKNFRNVSLAFTGLALFSSVINTVAKAQGQARGFILLAWIVAELIALIYEFYTTIGDQFMAILEGKYIKFKDVVFNVDSSLEDILEYSEDTYPCVTDHQSFVSVCGLEM